MGEQVLVPDRAGVINLTSADKYSMGKGLGGGSSINVGVWSRGHRQDWEDFAKDCGDPRWNYDSVLGVYRELETWRGDPIPDDGAWRAPCTSNPRSPYIRR